MNKIIKIILLLCIAHSAQAQQGPINILRHQDDFSYLFKSDTIQKKGLERLKCMPLSKNKLVNLSIGGDLREQYQYFKNANFGDLPPNAIPDTDGFFWHRAMLHADLRLGKQLRVFAQLSSTFAFGRPQLAPEIDENQLSLHQAFIQWKPLKKSSFFVQLGRQEFGFGSNLTLSMREGPNTRQTFDAVLFGLQEKNYKIYAAFASPTISQKGIFDDKHIPEFIWTVYSTLSLKKSFLDLYYFGFYSERRLYNYVPGIDRRHTFGLRWWAAPATGWSYSLELMGQFGKFNSQTALAYNFSSEAAYIFKLGKTKLAPGLGLNYVSGDHSNSDNMLNTFNLLYSKPAFGLAAPIGPSNIVNIRPMITFSPIAKIKIILSDYFLWRESMVDGTYAPNAVENRPRGSQLLNNTNRAIGQQFSLEAVYMLNKNLSFNIDAAYFLPGNYVSTTGNGKSIIYLSGKVTFKF